MQKKSVAVLDVGSSKITALVGERGINKTFVIKGRYEYAYDGYTDGAFLNEEQLKSVLSDAVSKIKHVLQNTIETLYVGVPGEFTKVFVKNSQVSFSAKKKITEAEIDMLFDSAFINTSANIALINRSAVVYELDDFRKTANPLGERSEFLKGKLSFITCSSYFIDKIKNALIKLGVANVECVSTSLCEALYLLDADTRDRIAVIVDIGYISTTYSVIQGDGIVFEKTFPFGGGFITANLTEKLDVDFSVAESLKRKVNLNSTISTGLIDSEDGKYYPSNEIKNSILNSIDSLCENISACMDESGFVLPEYVPLMITGGGISFLRGAKERVSSRVGMPVLILAPRVPMMENPMNSSVLSILDLAIEQN